MKDKVFRAASKARQAARRRRAVDLATFRQVALMETAGMYDLIAVEYPTIEALIDAIVEVEFPSLGDGKPKLTGPQPIKMDGNLMEIQVTDDPQGRFSYLDQTIHQRVRSDASDLVSMMAEANEKTFSWPGSTPTVDGGVNVLDVLKSKGLRWWQDRFFVAFGGSDSPKKLEVQEIKTLHGFGGDSREQHRVVVVKLPDWWLEIDYVEDFVKELEAAMSSREDPAGEALAVIERVKSQQGWQWDMTQITDDVPREPDLELRTPQEWLQEPGTFGELVDREAGRGPDTVNLPQFGSPEFEAEVQRRRDERSRQSHYPVSAEEKPGEQHNS